MAAPTTDRPVRDRFDTIPDDLYRVGAHRAKANWGGAWISVAWALGAIVVLSTAGLWRLSQINSDFSFGLPFAPAAQEQEPVDEGEPAPDRVEPKLDPDIVITVLNGTPTPGLSTTVADYLADQGWDGAAFGVGARVNASSTDVETTQVIYNDPGNEAAARAMLETLGTGELRLENTYPASPLAVLVGSDFALPAS